MTNLLSTPEISRAWKEYRARLVIMVSMLLLAGAIVMILALLPSIFILSSAESALAQEGSSSSAQAQFQRDKAQIAQTNFDSQELSSVLVSTSTPEQTILALLQERPSGVRIDHITYTTGAQGTILLGGTAESGDEVSAYRQTLSQDPAFTMVSVPVASLIDVQSTGFTITITGSL